MFTPWFQGGILLQVTNRIRCLWNLLCSHLVAERPALPETPSPPKRYRRIERVVLTEGIVETLFDDFEKHRDTARGEEEFGWAMLGVRDETEARVVALLPAGAQRHASLTHIQFHSNAQAAATRLLRQDDKTLIMLGVAHTHPGSLRHPSGGDYRGDVRFVARLRGGEGVFAIGTADCTADDFRQVAPHRFERGRLGFSWYALAQSDDHYRPLETVIVPGIDRASRLAPMWTILESHADALERLCQQLNGSKLSVAESADAIAFEIPLPDGGQRLRVLMPRGEARYYVEAEGELMAVDPEAVSVEHGIFAILAELARRRLSG